MEPVGAAMAQNAGMAPLSNLARRRLRLAFIGVLLGVALAGGAQARGYVPNGRCGPFERLALTTPAGTCAALVADDAQGLRFPRRVLEVAPHRLWLIDMGSWFPRQGRLLEVTVPTVPPATGASPAAPSAPLRAQVRVLMEGLDRPLALVRAPNGLIYVGEAGRVWRTPVPPPGQPPVPEVVLDGLPSDGAHPLKELAFAPDGTAYLNVGSFSDACRTDAGALPYPCPERDGPEQRAAVWRLELAPPGQRPAVVRREVFARGLRNSVALAVLPDGPAAGSVWQGENNIDGPDPNFPPEELNQLTAGGDYGWPYCVGQARPMPGYQGRADCRTTRKPLRLWPAHVAPLQLLVTPAASSFKGQLLVAWHGPGKGGQRVVGLARGSDGRPSGPPTDWISGWQEEKGVRPRGRPNGLALDHLGRLWVVEDFNRSLIVLMRPDGRGL